MTDPRAVLEALRDRMKRSAQDRRALSVYQERIAENHAPMALRAAAYDTESWVKELDAVVVGLPAPDVARMRQRVWNYINEDYGDDDSYAVDIMEDFLKMLGSDLPREDPKDAALRPQAQEQ